MKKTGYRENIERASREYRENVERMSRELTFLSSNYIPKLKGGVPQGQLVNKEPPLGFQIIAFPLKAILSDDFLKSYGDTVDGV